MILLSFLLLLNMQTAKKCCELECYYKAINSRVEFREKRANTASLTDLLNDTQDSSEVFSYVRIDEGAIGVLNNFLKYEMGEKFKSNANKNLTIYSDKEKVSALFLSNLSTKKNQGDEFVVKDSYMSNETAVINVFDLNHIFLGRITVFPKRGKLNPEFVLYKKEKEQAYSVTVSSKQGYNYENFQTDSLKEIADIALKLISELMANFQSSDWKQTDDISTTFYIKAWSSGVKN